MKPSTSAQRRWLGLKALAAILIFPIAGFAVELASTHQFNGHYYYMPSEAGYTWEQAREYAALQTLILPNGSLLSGHLVTITSQSEQDFIQETFMTSWWRKLWIGGYQYSHGCEPDGAWAWVTGEEAGNIYGWAYSFLATGQPGNNSNPYGNEDVLAMLVNGGVGGPPGTGNDTWHDFPSANPPGDGTFRFVVEFDETGDHFVRLDAPPKNVPLFCSGFGAPMDAGPVAVKKNRVLPLRARLLDGMGNSLTDSDIIAKPVLQITFDTGQASEDRADISEFAEPFGHGTDGNQFSFDGEQWHFNMRTKAYSAPGAYILSIESGDSCEYVIGSSCEARLVIE